MQHGQLLVLTGISAGGKTSITKAIRRRHPKLYSPISVTTRLPRTHEVHRVHYEFLSLDEYDELGSAGELLCGSPYYGAHYGIRRSDVEPLLAAGQHVFLETVVPNADQLLDRPDATIVFLKTVDAVTQRERLLARDEDELSVERRISYTSSELAWAERKNVITVVNQDLEAAIREVEYHIGLTPP